MFPWCHSHVSKTPAYAVGDIVYSGDCRGTVTQVSTVVARLISVVWDDGEGEIIYPMDASYLRKRMPWE